MPPYEYLKINLNDLRRGETDVDVLNAAGEQDWELISITANNIAYLMRDVEHEPEVEPDTAEATQPAKVVMPAGAVAVTLTAPAAPRILPDLSNKAPDLSAKAKEEVLATLKGKHNTTIVREIRILRLLSAGYDTVPLILQELKLKEPDITPASVTQNMNLLLDLQVIARPERGTYTLLPWAEEYLRRVLNFAAERGLIAD